jgi:hypothetical protein
VGLGAWWSGATGSEGAAGARGRRSKGEGVADRWDPPVGGWCGCRLREAG